MELLHDGRIVLDAQDMDGVRSLIFAKKRMVVDIHYPTEPSIGDFVFAWERVTGDDFVAGMVAGFE